MSDPAFRGGDLYEPAREKIWASLREPCHGTDTARRLLLSREAIQDTAVHLERSNGHTAYNLLD